ncbi:MAG: outer membrane lipoprotein-sorting protein [Verrucomicrobiota bacterium]
MNDPRSLAPRGRRPRAVALRQTVSARSSLFILAALVLLALLLLGWGRAVAAPDPNGVVPQIERVQANMIKNMKLADFKLSGDVRIKPRGGKLTKHPVVLRTKGYVMQFEFQDQPLQIKLDLDPDNERTQVFTRSGSSGSWKQVTGSALTKPILDSDITYEDLAMDFMKWEKVKPLGTDSIKTFDTWAYRAEPDGPSAYASADYWVSSQYYAFMQVIGRGKDGKPIKRVEVSDLQEVDGMWVIKEMMATTYRPGSNLAASQTWLYLDEAKKGASGL